MLTEPGCCDVAAATTIHAIDLPSPDTIAAVQITVATAVKRPSVCLGVRLNGEGKAAGTALG